MNIEATSLCESIHNCVHFHIAQFQLDLFKQNVAFDTNKTQRR